MWCFKTLLWIWWVFYALPCFGDAREIDGMADGVAEIEDAVRSTKFADACYSFKVSLLYRGFVEPMFKSNNYSVEIKVKGVSQKVTTAQTTFPFGWSFPKHGKYRIYATAIKAQEGKRRYSGYKDVTIMDKDIKKGVIVLTQRRTTLDKYVATRDKVELKIELIHGTVKDHSLHVTTFWYKDCEPLGQSASPRFNTTFQESNEAFEIVGVMVVTHQGEAPKESPYNCAERSVNKEQSEPIEMKQPDEEHFFTCETNSKVTVAAIGFFHKRVITRATKLLNGTIDITQNDMNATEFVTTTSPVRFKVHVHDDDEEVLKKAQSITTFWYKNCSDKYFARQQSISTSTVLNDTSKPYEITAVVVATYEGNPPSVSPYNCAAGTLKENIRAAVGVFKLDITARAAKFRSGNLTLSQNETDRTYVVATKSLLNMSIQLEADEMKFVDNASEFQTFWYKNCELMGKSPDMSFTETFNNTDEKFKIVGVIVAMYSGNVPEEPPYFCSNNTVKETENSIVGAYRIDILARDTLLGDGIIALTQGGIPRTYNVAIDSLVHMKLQLENEEKSYKKAKYVTTYWYQNCSYLARVDSDTIYQHMFTDEGLEYNITCVLVVTYEGKAPRDTPYDCFDGTLTEDITTAVGVYSINVFTTVLNISHGSIVLTQNETIRNTFVHTKDGLNMSITLEEEYDKIVNNASSFKTFWYKNCTLMDDPFDKSTNCSFDKTDEIYEIVGVIVAMYEGIAPNESPYTCSNNSVKEDINTAAGTFRTFIHTRGERTFVICRYSPYLLPSPWRIVAQLEHGKITLRQDGVLRTKAVTTNSMVNMTVELEGDDAKVLKAAKDVMTFCYHDLNCNRFEAPGNTTQQEFSESGLEVNITCLIVVRYEEVGSQDPPYSCSEASLELSINASVGLFKISFTTRDTKLKNGSISLTQNGDPRDLYVSTKTSLNMSVELEESDAKIVNNASSVKTFWYKGCKLMGTSSDRNFQYTFHNKNENHKIVGVIVAMYEGSATESPYSCSADKLKESINAIVGVYKTNISTRDTIFSYGYIELIQKGCVIPEYGKVSTKYKLNMTIKLERDEEMFLSKPYKTFWYDKDCKEIGTSSSQSFEHAFTVAGQQTNIIGVIVAMYNGTEEPTSSGYTCSNKTLSENINSIKGQYVRSFHTIDAKIGNRPIIVKQEEIIRKHFVATDDEFSMTLLLDQDDKNDISSKNHFRTFWYKDCKLLGHTDKETYSLVFRQAYLKHSFFAIMVATNEAEAPAESPVNCTNGNLEDNGKHAIVERFECIIASQDPITKITINGETRILAVKFVVMEISIIGSAPFKYCVLPFHYYYIPTGREVCEGADTQTRTVFETMDNDFEHKKKYGESKALDLVVSNEVSTKRKVFRVEIIPAVTAFIRGCGKSC